MMGGASLMNDALSRETLSAHEKYVVTTSDPRVQLEMSMSEAKDLVATGLYEGSYGTPIEAAHYRRSLNDGSCLHLVIREGRAYLHNDRFDPHRNVASLVSHLFTEAPVKTLESLAAAWQVLLIAAR
jgi:hypothetical protein